MASVATERNGRRRILFIGTDGKRRTIRLGECSLRVANAVRVRVEDLLSAKANNVPIDPATAAWIDGLPDAMVTKLSACGLVRSRETRTLATFLKDLVDSRQDINTTARHRLKRDVLGRR